MPGNTSPAAAPALAPQPVPPPRRTVDRIRADLLAGMYRPGEFLRLVEMEAHYGIGRFEVRSALANLAAVELLEHVPNRGYRVATLDEKEAWQHTELRLALELPAAILVLRHVNAKDCADPCNFSSSSGGRPGCLPRARAAAMPSRVRSTIRRRSKWAMALNTWNTSSPDADTVSRHFSSERNPSRAP